MRMVKKFSRHSQQGDTIVEVLIATAIISMVLAMAYATSNRNARVAQETREHTQAVKIAERQVEILRMAAYSNASIPNSGGCYAADGGIGNGSACNYTADGSGADYKVSITGPVNSVYSVNVQWDSLSGQRPDVTMRYILP